MNNELDWTSNVEGYRKSGAKIGKGVGIWGTIDSLRPDIVTIGNNVVIATQTILLTHCPVRMYKENQNIIIGNNVYIGYGSIILPGVKIGNNVIIGAGSVVSKDIPSDVIAVGNPCRVKREITEKESKRIYLLNIRCKEANGLPILDENGEMV